MSVGVELEIGLIDQGRCLKAVPGPLSGHAATRDAMEFLLDEGITRWSAASSPPPRRPGGPHTARLNHGGPHFTVILGR